MESVKRTRHARVFLLLIPFYMLTAWVFYLAFTTHYTPIDHLLILHVLILCLFVPVMSKYLLNLFIAPWYPLVESHRSKKHSGAPLPSVSVLVPAWNEEVGIARTLRSIIATRYPNLEVIVVNDGSTDGTHDVVDAFIQDHILTNGSAATSIHYRRLENGGKARALNHALALANGEIIITIDSDSIVDHRAIKNLVKHFADPRVASVAGNVAIGNRTRPIGLLQQLEYLYGFYFKRADSILSAVYIVGGAAAAYRTSVIKSLGGFDESIITEDIELSTRIQYHGYRVRYAADAIVYTEGPSDMAGLCRQRLRWKFGRLITFYKYRNLFFSLKRRHNQYLTFVILPMAMFSECVLLFEGILVITYCVFTFATHDFVPLAFVIVLLTIIISFQIATDHEARYHRNLYLLAPVAWVLFYFTDFVEFQALLRSIHQLIVRKELTWQKWKRVGITAPIS